MDLLVPPEAYSTRRDRAFGQLGKDRPDVRRLLLWAERQHGEIGTTQEVSGAAEAGVKEDVGYISYALFEAIKFIVHDNLLSRARSCDGHGLELWRKLFSEWEGAAP